MHRQEEREEQFPKDLLAAAYRPQLNAHPRASGPAAAIPTEARREIFQHLDSLVPELAESLAMPGCRVLVVHGMPGSGKTVVTKHLFDRVKAGFQRAHFMPVGRDANVGTLLRSSWSALFPDLTCPRVDDVSLLADIVKRFDGQSVLLVLDDVWEREHLSRLNFATALGLGHQGSRLIVTTRDAGVVRDLQPAPGDLEPATLLRQMPLLQAPFDQHLLCFHAFGQLHAPESHAVVARAALDECKGLPLALEVVGAALRGKTVDEWEVHMRKMRAVDPKLSTTAQLVEHCRPSYDALSLFPRQGFLLFAGYSEDHRVPVSVAVLGLRAGTS
jgi:hypothetical protein